MKEKERERERRVFPHRSNRTPVVIEPAMVICIESLYDKYVDKIV